MEKSDVLEIEGKPGVEMWIIRGNVRKGSRNARGQRLSISQQAAVRMRVAVPFSPGANGGGGARKIPLFAPAGVGARRPGRDDSGAGGSPRINGGKT